MTVRLAGQRSVAVRNLYRRATMVRYRLHRTITILKSAVLASCTILAPTNPSSYIAELLFRGSEGPDVRLVVAHSSRHQKVSSVENTFLGVAHQKQEYVSNVMR